MPFLRCTEDHGYIMHVAEVLAQYVVFSSYSLLMACLDIVAFDKDFNRLYVYNHFDDRVQETIFVRRLKAPGDSCYLIN